MTGHWRIRRPLVWLLATTFFGLLLLQWLSLHLTPVHREQVQRPLFVVADGEASDLLGRGETVTKCGALPLGLYRGTQAFRSSQEALLYLQQAQMLQQGWAVFVSSGDFELDTYEFGGNHWTKQTLRLVEQVAPRWAAQATVRR